MNKESIYHIVDAPYAFAVGPSQLKIRIRTKKNDIVDCQVFYTDRFSFPLGNEDMIKMTKVASDLLFDYFETVIDIKTKRPRYKFYLIDQNGNSIWYGEDGFTMDSKLYNYFQFPYICEQDIFIIPEWAKESIVYQIFPQSFNNGDISNDPPNVTSMNELPDENTFYGGDLQGIIDKIFYLNELGVNTLYLTPIFKAASPHKYDTIDYLDIDPNFGDKKTFRDLVEKCHANGIRIILDAVFTFCGYEFFAFQDVIDNEKESKYLDWFNIYNFPITKSPTSYETFVENIWKLPKIYKNNPEAREYLLEVSRFWIEDMGIDGWRLDTANEVEHDFWKDFRKVVKKVNPEALIIGEVWHNAGPWLRGDEFDSVMNYKFQGPVIDFFAKQSMDIETFDGRLAKARMAYTDQANFAAFNLLDSHDTERFLNICEEKIERMRLAVIFQLTYIGQPMIYYGDEVGMTGGNDPDCRRPMIWNEKNQNFEMLNLYKKLIHIRRNNKALTHGDYITWIMEPLKNIYGYIRKYENQVIAVVLNNGEKEQTLKLEIDWLNSNQKSLIEVLSDTEYIVRDNELEISLPSYGGAILM